MAQRDSNLLLHERLSVGIDSEAEGLCAEVLELGVDESDGPAAFVDGRGGKAAVAGAAARANRSSCHCDDWKKNYEKLLIVFLNRV